MLSDTVTGVGLGDGHVKTVAVTSEAEGPLAVLVGRTVELESRARELDGGRAEVAADAANGASDTS